MKNLLTAAIIVFTVTESSVFAQYNQPKNNEQDSSRITKKRITAVAIGGSVLYAGSIVAFNELWYKNQPRSGFHFFNDNTQWKQADKAGHFYSAFHLSRAGVDIMNRTGVERKKAIWWGSLFGVIYQTPIEILDGFSAEYGASWGDVIANTAGSGLVLGQHLLWDEIRIMPKFSFHTTPFADQRPNVLGENLAQQIFKDYNGQTYWLSFDMYSFLKKESKFPKWLNIAVGYGAENMIYARDSDNLNIGIDPHRQYYLAFDLDLMHFKTKNKLLNTVLYVLNSIHIPGPTVEYNRIDGFRTHVFYF